MQYCGNRLYAGELVEFYQRRCRVFDEEKTSEQGQECSGLLFLLKFGNKYWRFAGGGQKIDLFRGKKERLTVDPDRNPDSADTE